MEESESEVEISGEEEKQGEENMAAAPHKYVTTQVMAPSGVKGRQKTKVKSSEEVRALGCCARSKLKQPLTAASLFRWMNHLV